MTLTKPDIAQALAERNGYTRIRALDLVEAVLELIKKTLASGEDVMISGFGKFNVNEKATRKGRNP